MKKLFIIFVIGGLFCYADPFEVSHKANQNAKELQRKIDDIDGKKRDKLLQYHSVIKEIENTKKYNEQLERLIASQEIEKTTITNEINTIDETARSLLPLLEKMVKNLDLFVEKDLPFLLNERRARVARLYALLDRADLAISEKYRVVLETYMIENEYSKTIESYLGNIDSKEVEFFRIGRVALYYLTLDHKNAFMFDEKSSSFIKINNEKELIKAIKMAKKETLPDLISLPVKSAK